MHKVNILPLVQFRGAYKHQVYHFSLVVLLLIYSFENSNIYNSYLFVIIHLLLLSLFILVFNYFESLMIHKKCQIMYFHIIHIIS